MKSKQQKRIGSANYGNKAKTQIAVAIQLIKSRKNGK